MSNLAAPNSNKKTYSLFEVFGVELEYMIVDQETLEILPITDRLFQDISGEITDEIERGQITLNNELALHVVELKTTKPEKDLSSLPELFEKEIRSLQKYLKKHHARLLPSAMHPWMDSYKETKLWPHGDATIYNAFHKIFDCRGHGWGNLQSVHLNLPFSQEEEFVKLHSAIRLILPLIPTLAASSPFADGAATGFKDTRLKVYQSNCKKIFSVTGHIIPEYCGSIEEYHQKILQPIYKDLKPYDPQGVLQNEWVNARGAITRFSRQSIEIRLIDIQEAPLMDLAIVKALASLIGNLIKKGDLEKFDEVRLKKILEEGIQKGEEAWIDDLDYLKVFDWQGATIPAKELWKHLFDNFIDLDPVSRNQLEIIIKEGTLATRLLKKAGNSPSKDTLRKVYSLLGNSLDKGTPFIP
ncbi:carboxylate-amine ligase [Criblamydia sequanensis]|uniref:Glutamate-cysteine ligase n=1 Tax=Candidatus Criblamydia sequanensis CRIB-18 TaxID=1437425 RepID=A0A090CYC4_9BACT|nr:glutamate-cysteine ligase family protein [Criblamydia sequanensis]CDR33301.1 Glutamate-cysteine ligase [Criblamydia sequanensis CRIB-18]